MIILGAFLICDTQATVDDLVDRFVSKLFDRELKELPLYHAHLDDTTLGKVGHLKIPGKNGVAGFVQPYHAQMMAIPHRSYPSNTFHPFPSRGSGDSLNPSLLRPSHGRRQTSIKQSRSFQDTSNPIDQGNTLGEVARPGGVGEFKQIEDMPPLPDLDFMKMAEEGTEMGFNPVFQQEPILLPAPLRAIDGKEPGARPQDVFTWDTVTKRMPSILENVLETLPEEAKNCSNLVQAVRSLQQEMEQGKELQYLKDVSPWIGAEVWNKELAQYIDGRQGWHHAPWWVVENYMYKRLLEILAENNFPNIDPFATHKAAALDNAAGIIKDEALTGSKDGKGINGADRDLVLSRLLGSLWANKVDLSLSAGKQISATDKGPLLTDDSDVALQWIFGAEKNKVIIVVDNQGVEFVNDLMLTDVLLNVVNVALVELHVKDAPVFVSDVTEADVEPTLEWCAKQNAAFAERLRTAMASGRLVVVPHSFYTTARPLWDFMSYPDLLERYRKAPVVIFKGDANYRRLLDDRKHLYYTGPNDWIAPFWPADGVFIALRTLKSGVAMGIQYFDMQKAEQESPNDWMTSGKYGQILLGECSEATQRPQIINSGPTATNEFTPGYGHMGGLTGGGMGMDGNF